MNEKNKILKMLEDRKISAAEASDLLAAVESVSRVAPSAGPGDSRELKMAVYGPKGEEVKSYGFSLDEIVVSALMNKINLELRHSGISASMDEIKNIKESIMSRERFVLDKNYKKAEIWIE